MLSFVKILLEFIDQIFFLLFPKIEILFLEKN